jgi:hypothetical protein
MRFEWISFFHSDLSLLPIFLIIILPDRLHMCKPAEDSTNIKERGLPLSDDSSVWGSPLAFVKSEAGHLRRPFAVSVTLERQDLFYSGALW